jgi:hypothetical protein
VALLDSYCEISPSGAGLRLFIEAMLPRGRKSKGGVEMYNSGRYLTLTGHRLPGTSGTVEPRQAQLDELRHAVFGDPQRKATQPSHQSFRPRAGAAQSAIEDALTYISAEDYETWLYIGMALHAELAEAGRPIWDLWSRTSAKYDEGDQNRTWRGFHADGGIHVGTLFHYARNAGWPGNRTVLLYDTETGQIVEERVSG